MEELTIDEKVQLIRLMISFNEEEAKKNSNKIIKNYIDSENIKFNFGHEKIIFSEIKDQFNLSFNKYIFNNELELYNLNGFTFEFNVCIINKCNIETKGHIIDINLNFVLYMI